MRTDKKSGAIDVCDICQQRTLVRKLARDHDHASGEWRGNLCARCNMGLGHFKDDPERMMRAAKYVSYWRAAHNEDTDTTFEQWEAAIG